MRYILLLFFLLFFFPPANSQSPEYFSNGTFLRMLDGDSSYTKLKKKVVSEFVFAQPGHWGEFVKGVDEDIITQKKVHRIYF
jgi:hypothetical protein